MSNLSLTTGLISGLDIAGLVEALATNQQRAIDRLDARVKEFDAQKTAIGVLEANVLTLSTSVSSLKNKITFEQQKVTNAGADQFKVSVGKTAINGSYTFQSVQQASAHQSLSRGFADATEQKVGEGTIVISQGGFLDEPTLLESLNDGSGIRRGQIRITDRSGSSTVISLTEALNVDDVLNEINSNVDISVSARVVDGRFVLEDTSGSTSTNLAVVDLNGGSTAANLGIDKSVSSATLDGDDVFKVTENFSLKQINDGNGVTLLTGAADIKINLSDGTNLEVNLDGVKSLKDVLTKINDHDDNADRVSAEIVSGRIVLTDNTSGVDTLSVEDINNSSVVKHLGLNATSSGNTLTGNRLSGGLNSVLLRNIRGGQGIETLGEISITDRSGQTATIDLSSAETLTDIIEAINAATEDGTGDKLLVKVSINDLGNGLIIKDTSGATDSNLIIADVDTGTAIADLGLTIDDAVTEIDSKSLHQQYVNKATLLSDYAPDGGAVEVGLFQITDSDGNVGVINITSAVKNIGDVITRINANSSVSVRAELNETGDGFVLIDEAGGAGTLAVEEFGQTTTAADLRLLREPYTSGDGAKRISSRKATIVDIDDDDTLTDVVSKMNAAGSAVKASVFDDGSSFNSKRLSVTATQTGKKSRLVFDDGDLDLNFATIAKGQNAILRVGADPASAFLISSKTNRFDGVVQGIDLDITNVGFSAAKVEIEANTESIVNNLKNFISTYNQFIDIGSELTKFDTESNQRGILQGDTFVLRVTNRMSNALGKRFGIGNETIQSLSALGVRVGAGGILELNEDRLQEHLRNDFNGVKEFFTQKDTGFGDKINSTLTSLTDIVDGSFTNERNSLTSSIDTTNERIEELKILLESKKARLLNEFIQTESILGSLETQQTALAGIKSISVPSR